MSEKRSGRETPSLHIEVISVEKREGGVLINADDGTPIEVDEKTKETRKREAEEDARYQNQCDKMREDLPRETHCLFDVLTACLHSYLRLLMKHPAMGFTEKQIDRYAEVCEDLLKQHESLTVIGPEVFAYAEQLRDGVRNYSFDVRIAYAITGLVHEWLSYYGDGDWEAIRRFARIGGPSFNEMWALLANDLAPFIGSTGLHDFEKWVLSPEKAE